LAEGTSPKQSQTESLTYETKSPNYETQQLEVLTPFFARIQNPFENKIILFDNIIFALVPSGKFIMGSNNAEKKEKPQHIVDISDDYWISRFLITNEQYYIYTRARENNHPVTSWKDKKDHPVTNVSWENAMNYCSWLNSLFLIICRQA
jgi:formylglycine-generating enzyme required for sulfatase activity